MVKDGEPLLEVDTVVRPCSVAEVLYGAQGREKVGIGIRRLADVRQPRFMVSLKKKRQEMRRLVERVAVRAGAVELTPTNDGRTAMVDAGSVSPDGPIRIDTAAVRKSRARILVPKDEL